MRKKKEQKKPLYLYAKPNGYVYCLQEIDEDGNRTLIEKDLFYKSIMETLRIQSLLAIDNDTNKHYSVVIYTEHNFLKKEEFEKEVINFQTKSFLKNKVKAISYINCIEYLFDDRQLLEKVENVALDYYSKYNDSGNYREMLDVGELRDLYRSIKNTDWEQYQTLCDQFDMRARLYSQDFFEEENLAWG